jgi:hypothetical protein
MLPINDLVPTRDAPDRYWVNEAVRIDRCDRLSEKVIVQNVRVVRVGEQLSRIDPNEINLGSVMLELCCH